jgi:hypothetical protein
LHVVQPVMPRSQPHSKDPPLPRSLSTIRGARLELCRLYKQTRTGEVEPNVAGKLAHILSLLIGSARDHAFEDRLAALEKQFGIAPAKGNGHARSMTAGMPGGDRLR